MSAQRPPLWSRLYVRLRRLIVPFGVIEGCIPRKCTVVDIGCGFGVFANFVASRSGHRDVVGIDLAGKRISAAKKNYGGTPNLSFVCADITRTDIPKADVITLVDVLHHVPSRERQQDLLGSCFAALSGGGAIIVKDVDTRPRWKYCWNRVHDYVMTGGGPVLYLGRDDVRAALARAGFRMERVLQIGNYPYAHVLYVGRKGPA